jgi:hypothetical protein
MSTTIGNVPAGLLSILRAQNFGENPRELNPVVSAVIDVRDEYIFNNIEHAFALFTVDAGFVSQDPLTLSGEVTFLVPPGELWWIDAVSLRLNPAAGFSWRGQIVLFEPPQHHIALSALETAAALDHFLVRGREGFWMEPGTRLKCNFDRVTGGVPAAATALMTVRFARFRI